MKHCLIFATFLTFAFANNEDILKQSYLDGPLPREFIQDFFEKIKDIQALRAGSINAICNEYADKIFGNIQNFIIHKGLDPLELPEVSVKLIPAGIVNMTQGWLQEIATIRRNGDVITSYSTADRKLKMTIPITFDVVTFSYNYRVKVMLLGISGGVDGKVSKLRLNMQLEFDFSTYQAKMNKFDITDSGLFSIHFTGHGLVDWLINLMSDATTFVLHPLIVRIIQFFIQGPVNIIIEQINAFFNYILHYSTSF